MSCPTVKRRSSGRAKLLTIGAIKLTEWTLTTLPKAIRCDKHGTCLIFDLRRGAAELVYVGPSLPDGEDPCALADAQRRGRHESQPDSPPLRSILPHDGWSDSSSAAITLQRDGAPLALRFALENAVQTDDGVSFGYLDKNNDIQIELHWQIAASGIVESKACLQNTGVRAFGLVELSSLTLPLPGWATHATRYAGRWAAEMQQSRVKIEQGEFGSASFGGRPGFGGGNWIRIESADLSEYHGHEIAAHLAWSGDHRLRVEANADGDATLFLLARLEPGEIIVRPGESWTPPRALFAVSDKGVAPNRHAFHHFALAETLPQSGLATPRKVHLNSWEALGFDLDMTKLKALAVDAAELGVERFVLDDGWFKGRRSDNSSLGDWFPDTSTFPHGLTPLIHHVRGLGMDFGLWVEPEMVSPESELYRAHPDWCVHVPGQPRPTQRNQLVLDLTRTEVSAYLFARLDGLLSENAIAYLKWDHNRDLFPLAGKGYAQVVALYALLDRLRAAHPDVEIETCASGGGRIDFEILRRCDRFWASDNNDAIERLRINAGWFDFLPLRAAGNHVGPSPNPITGRRLSMDFRAKVAMFGHMGVEANPAGMSDGERASLSTHIALYKEWRTLLHGCELWKVETDLPGVFGWLARSGTKGLALIAQTAQSSDFGLSPVRFPGLDRSRRYRVRLVDPWPSRGAEYLASPECFRDGIELSGVALGEIGLALPLSRPETAWLVSLEMI